MNISDEAQIARQRMVEAAHDMLDGSLTYIEGSRRISRLRWGADLSDFDPDILPFIGIDSETDTFPLEEVRQYWRPDALANLQPEFEKAEEWARDLGREACEKLIKRFGE